MNLHEIRKVLVVGAGLMGGGIAQVFAQAGYQVYMVDMAREQLDRALKNIEKMADSLIKKGILTTAGKEQTLANIHPVTDLEAAADADFVVEAVSEKKDLKFTIFRELDRNCRPGVILASNTSSISITEIAAVTSRPEYVVGTHFMSPVPLMKCVELIRGLQTADEVYKVAGEIVMKIGKEPGFSADYPGFISNRIFLAFINEAICCVHDQMGAPEDIDKIMKLSFNHPVGPLRLADNIGLDTILNILEVLYEGYRHPKYIPCPLLVKMNKAGWLGRKSGRGFYIYDV